MPELKRNILNFGYRINFKYEGMISHSSYRFYVVTKFILPSINDLKLSPIHFNSESSYFNADLSKHQNTAQYISNLKIYCRRIIPFIDFIRNKLLLIITQHMKYFWYYQIVQKIERQKSIIASVIRGYIGSAHKGISSYLCNKGQEALHKAFMAITNKKNL